MADAPQHKKQQPNWIYLTPMFLTMLPLVRIVFRKQPVIRDRLFYGIVAVGLVHGFTLIANSTKVDEEVFAPPPRVLERKAAAASGAAVEVPLK